jgi:arsenite methyltransferase
MSGTHDDLDRPRGDYGVDAPLWPAALIAAGAAFVALAVGLWLVGTGAWAVLPLLAGLWFGASAASYLFTTRVGKFLVWADLLRQLDLRGDERVLDMGCGRGAVLLKAAQLVPAGRAIGIDLWKGSDQSGNSPDVTRRNAEREGVADRIDLHTGDMTAVLLADASVDLVVSSLAIHNIESAEGRAQALDEAVRVLKPGGRLVIADLRYVAGEYAGRLRERGMQEVRHRRLGWRFWYGGPWAAADLVTARRSE